MFFRAANARAKVDNMPATSALLNSPGAFAKIKSAQRELPGTHSRLLAENYPPLKSHANFRELHAKLEGTESRIVVARNRYIKDVQEFNVAGRSSPSHLTAMAFGYKTKPNFTMENENEISDAPKVDFARAFAKSQAKILGATK